MESWNQQKEGFYGHVCHESQKKKKIVYFKELKKTCVVSYLRATAAIRELLPFSLKCRKKDRPRLDRGFGLKYQRARNVKTYDFTSWRVRRHVWVLLCYIRGGHEIREGHSCYLAQHHIPLIIQVI